MEAEKNKISTGTLTYEDIHNKAEYEAGSMGINIDTSKDADKKEAGVTPNIGMPAEDKAESDTKATIAEGEIEIRNKDKQKQDLKYLNRDTRNSLNKLGEIFDKESIQERQELAGLFGELAYNQIHDMKGTDEQKAAYHALVGGIMSQLTSGDFLAGASAAAVNKLVMSEIKKIARKDPAMMQWLSAAVGAVAGEVVGFNNWLGAAIDISATKFNELAENPEKVLIAVYPGLIGHVSLVIDNEEINYGRYVDSSSSGSLQSPIGEAGIIIYKDFENKKGDNPGTEVLVLDLTPEEAKQVVQVFKNIINKDAYFWQEKVDENKSALDAAYRFNEDVSYKDYVLWKRNCTTFTMDILKSALGEDDPRIKTIKNDWIPGLVGADLAYMNKNK